MNSNPNILIIDDEENMRGTLSDILEDSGYCVASIAKGKDAFELIKKKDFDIVMVDIKLSDMNGIEILRATKEINPETAIIMMTGYASTESAIDALNKGAYAYVTKPFNLDEVKAIIKKALKEIRLLQENKKLVEDLQKANKDLEYVNKKLKEAGEAKSQFLANMSHELRTPLNSIIGFAEILIDELYGNVNEKQKEFLRHIHISGKILLQLINDILNLSKIEAGKLELEYNEFSLGELIDEVYKTLLALAEKRKIKMEVIIEKKLSKVFADFKRIEQVLVNLVNNAIKFTPSDKNGNIKIIAKEDENEFKVIVEDTGIGIEPHNLAVIFDTFKQLDSKISKEYEGTGLGLAIVKKLVEMHNGKVFAESEYGKWSKFTFTIPKQKV